MQPESGAEYLRRLAEQYDMAKRVLPTLPEDEFAKIRRESAGKELGVGSFLMDFAIGAETRRRNLERWATGRAITPASTEHATSVISVLPSYTTVNSEALGALRVERAKTFGLDVIVEDILLEIAQRLPRTIDAYRYHQDYAHETLSVPGIGEIKVTMHETGDGIFRTIGTVDSNLFRVWNCRQSGVTYMDRWNDNSRPSDIEAKPLATKVTLYDDESGIYVERQGKEFTNSRVNTAEGRGYASDHLRDDLHRTYDRKKPYGSDESWRKDKTVLSFKKTEEEMIVWLVDNVLNPLREAPKPESQITELPEEEPFPGDKVGPLYTFVDEEDLRKIALVKDNPGKAYPDERKAVRSNRRLLSLFAPRGKAPKVVYDGFVWCGVGIIDHETDLKDIKYIGSEYRWDDPPFHSQGVAIIKPKTATDVYVVDWEETGDPYKAENMDRLQTVAETIIPIAEYQGNYKKPIVLISRDLELDEIEAVFLPPGRETSNF